MKNESPEALGELSSTTRQRARQKLMALGLTVVTAASLAVARTSAETGRASSYQAGIAASVKGRTIRLNGEDTLLTMAWRQCPADVDENLEIGINAFVGISAPCSQTRLANTVDSRAYLIPEYPPQVEEQPKTIGYHLEDEPDGHRSLPDAQPKTRRVSETGRLILQTLTAHYAAEQAKLAALDSNNKTVIIDREEYLQYIANVDMVGTDIYPLSKFCRDGDIDFESVYHYQRELNQLADDKPTFQWVEVNSISGECGNDPVSPRQMRAEVWMSLAGGATSVGYFTHSWTSGIWDRFDVSPQMQTAVASVNKEAQALSPILLAPQLAYASGPKDPIKVGGRLYRGSHYLIAVNSSDNRVSWERRLTSFDLRNRKIGIYGEDRWLRAKNGIINDQLDPYEVRIYHWKP